jgi:hypothetical protein
MYPDTAVFIFKVSVSDIEGLCDISDVHYDGTNPNGGQLTRQFCSMTELLPDTSF